MKRKPISNNVELARAIQEFLKADLPETPDEVNAVLLAAGLNPVEVAQEGIDFIKKELEESPLHWKNQARARKKRTNDDPDPEPLPKTRKGLLETIQNLATSQTLSLQHRNLDQMSDSDLASLITEIRQLKKDRDNGNQ